MRRVFGLALLLVLGSLAGPAPRAAAQDDPTVPPNDPGYQFYEKAAARILRTAGAKVWEAADAAKKLGLFQFAIEHAERAIGFDPDHKDAREHLKYEKKNEKWVRNEDEWNSPNTKKQNQKQSNVSQESFDKMIEKWKTDVLRPADMFVAAKYADLGDECAAKGHPEQAKKGWEASLRLDKDNAKARKGLGYKKLGKVWLTDKQDKARKDAAKGAVVKEPSSWDEFFGAKLNKVETVHFRIESPYPEAELLDYAAAVETAYAYYLADFGIDPADDVFHGHRMTYVVMQTDPQWNSFVDAYGGTDKEFTRQLSGTGDGGFLHGVRSRQGSTPAGRKDQLVHNTVHTLNKHVWRVEGHAWINEGLAYYYTLKVLETTSTHCVALKKGDYANPGDTGGIKKWDDPANWKSKLKEQVRGKADAELRALVYIPIQTLEYAASVKAWGVITWMMDVDRDRWISTLEQLRSGMKDEDALQGVWEKGLEELDAEWRKWVVKTY